MIRVKAPLLLTLFLVAASGCGGSRRDTTQTAAQGSPGPALTVERFLQAANANDLETMMQLFGTADRTIVQIDGQARAERRMYVLATLLHHDDYTIVSQAGVPGRMKDATELQVRLRRGDRSVVVPHMVVRKKGGGWIIEKIDIEKLTQSS